MASMRERLRKRRTRGERRKLFRGASLVGNLQSRVLSLPERFPSIGDAKDRLSFIFTTLSARVAEATNGQVVNASQTRKEH